MFQYKKTGDILHLLEYSLCDDNQNDVHCEFMIFSLQVLNLEEKFTAADCFNVNYTLLFKTVGALVTYLIIIMQLGG